MSIIMTLLFLINDMKNDAVGTMHIDSKGLIGAPLGNLYITTEKLQKYKMLIY